MCDQKCLSEPVIAESARCACLPRVSEVEIDYIIRINDVRTRLVESRPIFRKESLGVLERSELPVRHPRLNAPLDRRCVGAASRVSSASRRRKGEKRAAAVRDRRLHG